MGKLILFFLVVVAIIMTIIKLVLFIVFKVREKYNKHKVGQFRIIKHGHKPGLYFTVEQFDGMFYKWVKCDSSIYYSLDDAETAMEDYKENWSANHVESVVKTVDAKDE